jgi:sugar phosphate isomerase/epimerase
MGLPIGAQLYSVREQAESDYTGTLEALAAMGFAGVEFYGRRALKASELKACLHGLGMVSIGYHVPMDELRDNLDEVLEYNRSIGSGYIVCPWHTYRGRQDYIDAAAFFGEVGRKCANAGMRFCYHHHGQEFEPVDGERGLDILFRHAPLELVLAELDTQYIRFGGEDPAAYMEAYRGRCPLLHLRDAGGRDGKSAAPMGRGMLDMADILGKASECGVRWLISEEVCEPAEAMEAMRKSHDYLAGIQAGSQH